MLPTKHSCDDLKPLLEQCGYTGSCLAEPFSVGDKTFPLVGFAGKPWDSRSACVAVVDGNGSPQEAAASCRDLGAPIVWVRHNKTVDWWTQHEKGPSLFDSKPLAEFRRLVRRHKADLKPEEVYRLKTLGRLPGARQLDFVDAGLMPLLEARAGGELGGLVEDMTRAVLEGLRLTNPGKGEVRDVFKLVFRLLAGKILHDKEVTGFKRIALDDPRAVLTAVQKHYNAAGPAPILNKRWIRVLSEACRLITGFGNVRVVSPETLAYVYEHTLVSKPLRKKLGIHATPLYLVDYILWQLYDWIREIPVDERHVFEPGSGHSPFLLAAMRMLRLELQGESDRTVHAYLKQHVHGVEIDDFAREIARLSLTLADIPNPNGWDLQAGDMYASDILAEQSRRCRILLSNPPYERFEPVDKRAYAAAGLPVRHSKAVELLDRTLPLLSPGAVFGVVVPQGVLHSNQANEVRTLLLNDFEIREICLFADKLFAEGDAETAVLLGRRLRSKRMSRARVLYRRVREDAVPRFAESYAADSEQVVEMATLAREPDASLFQPDLPKVWGHLAQHDRLDKVASVGQGFSFEREGDIDTARQAGKRRTCDSVPVFLIGVKELSIWEVPTGLWLSPSRTPVKHWRSGNHTGKPQVLVNYARAMRGPWRIKALLDTTGHAVTNTYTTVRPREDGPPVLFLWALLNSPLANAYVHCNTFRRHIYDTMVAAIPLPQRWRSCVGSVVKAAESYLELVQGSEGFALGAPNESAVREALLRLDAEVMRAYRLPVRLERALLDLFRLPPAKKQGRRRKGVGCEFGDYFPADLESLIPLHTYVSAGYRGSTVDAVAARMKPGESDAVLRDLRTAADAFGGD
ncbi:MAG: N-6 DNA methylase [bacterium]|nr:N-6 DNA methylase [bacterium]